jgi:hypothetical protein
VVVALAQLTGPERRLLDALREGDVVIYEHSRGRDQYTANLKRLGLIDLEKSYIVDPQRPLSRRHGRHRMTIRLTDKGSDLYRPWKAT